MPIPWVRRKSDEERAAEIAAKSIEEFGEKLELISKADIKSKDRVDISLDEYLMLKGELERNSRELRHARYLLGEMGIPPDIISAIDSKSIHVETCEDFQWFKRHYRITFAVDTSRFI